MLSALLMAQLLDPMPVVPSPRQLAWHKMEYYAFCHFGPNTFTGNEWGSGGEQPDVFNPTKLDCKQWARTFKAAGMTGVIITAKHHDGFCLWPSKYSTHSVAQSKWREGKGDVLKELSLACRQYGLRFGVYLSPWDRNHPAYGTAEYNRIFANMLEEVLTRYGPVFEVWFDGANGEGPNGKKQVYDWNLFIDTVRKFQPNACIFSDAGPDVRWVGNENGIASGANWCTLTRDRVTIGAADAGYLNFGDLDGKDWVPFECDVSIRPGWFFRDAENAKVKTEKQLEDIYYWSVGRGGNLLLNVPPDKLGLIHPNDARALMELRKRLDGTFSKDLALNTKTDAKEAVDGISDTYTTASQFTIETGKPVIFDRVSVSEAIRLGQRVVSFDVEALVDSEWRPLYHGPTIGNKRILRIPSVTTSKVRMTVTKALATPAIASFELYKSP